MKITITTNDFLLIFPEIENIYKQNIKFKINTALKLLKLYKESDEINSYILDRIKLVIPGLTENGYILTDTERDIYNNILLSPIEFETYDLTIEELMEGCDATVGVSSLEKLLQVL